MKSEPEKFRDDLATLFPDRSTKRAGRMLDVSQRAVQRWVTDGDVPINIDEAMKAQLDAIQASDFTFRLNALVTIARDAGIHDEVIAAHLDQVAQSLLGRDNS